MNIQQRDHFSGLEKTLESFGALLQEKNVSLLAEFYEIIDEIKSKIENISQESLSPIQKRALYVHQQVIDLIGGQELELENISISVREKSIFLSKRGVIMVHEGDIESVSLSKVEYICIESIFQHGNSLSVQDEARGKLRKVIQSLNSKFAVFGIYFGIQNNIFSCVDSPFEDEQQEVTEPILLHSNILYFGTNGEQSIKLEIYSPIKERNTYKIKCVLGKKQCIFSKTEFEYFLSLLQAGDQGSEASYLTSRNLHQALTHSSLELIGTTGRLEKLALRTKSLENIKYLQRTSEEFPEFDDVFLQTQKKQTSKHKKKSNNTAHTIDRLRNDEKMDMLFEGHHILTQSTVGNGRLKKFYITIDEIEIILTGNEHNFLKEFSLSSKKVLIEKRYYITWRNIIQKLQKKGLETFIKKLQAKRLDGRSIKNHQSKSKCGCNELSEEETISLSLGGYRFQTQRSEGNGRRKKIFIEIVSEKEKIIIILSRKQNELFKNFLEAKDGTIHLSPAGYQTYMQLKKIFKNNNLDAVIDLFEAKIQKRKKKNIKNASNKSNEIHDDEKIDIVIGQYHIKVDAKRGRGRKANYYLDIKHTEGTQHNVLTLSEFEILKLLTDNLGEPLQLDYSTPTINRLRNKLPHSFVSKKYGGRYYIPRTLTSQKSLIKSGKKAPKFGEQASLQKVKLRIVEPKIKNNEKHCVQLPLMFELEYKCTPLKFSLDKGEGWDNYVLKCYDEIITRPFILDESSLDIILEIINGDCVSLNAHLKSRLEQNTPLSLKREGGKIVFFLKQEISKPKPSLIRGDDNCEFIARGVRCVLVHTHVGENQKASLYNSGNSNIQISLSQNLYKQLEKLLSNYSTGEYIVLDQGMTTVNKLQKKFNEIGVRDVFEISKNGNTKKIRLRH